MLDLLAIRNYALDGKSTTPIRRVLSVNQDWTLCCLQSFSIMLAEFYDLGCDHDLAVGLSCVLLEIFLMVIFSLVERLERRYLRHDWFLPDFRGIRFFDNLLSHCFLFGVVVEDCRPVLATDISALSIQGGRVVRREEDLQNILEGNLLGIEGYLDRLSVSSGSGANIFVRRVRSLSTGAA